MIDAASFKNIRLQGGFIVTEIEFAPEPLADALGREAAAQTRIVGNKFHLLLRSGLSQRELSVTLYHEVLEAASVASPNPPGSVMDFNEADFERAARAMHDESGEVSPENLNRMLQFHDFREE